MLVSRGYITKLLILSLCFLAFAIPLADSSKSGNAAPNKDPDRDAATLFFQPKQAEIEENVSKYWQAKEREKNAREAYNKLEWNADRFTGFADEETAAKYPAREKAHNKEWMAKKHRGLADEGLKTESYRGLADDDRWMLKGVTCDVCKAFAGTIMSMVNDQKSEAEIIKVAIAICKAEHIETERVCDLVVPEFKDMVFGVAKNTVLNADEICSILIGDSCALPYDPEVMWNITIPDTPKPPVRPHVLPKPGSPTLRVLHLSDIHLDMEYKPGADSQCGEPLCCRAYDQYPAPTQERRAGEWGDYHDCDVPWTTLHNLFRHLSFIKKEFDIAYFTGDIPAHDVWNQTRTQQLSNLERLANLFRKYLPNTPVFTCLGNHEGVPVNSFPPSSVQGTSNQWLYSAQLEAWGYWLPQSAWETIMKGGFYTVSPFPGFRIISFNSNFGSSENWWLLINQTDPEGQLQWLADVLQEAEDKGEKVHILSHHPPSSSMKSFGLNYYRLVNRYENTITAQFQGHSHTDEYRVFYDLHNKTRPVGVAYVGGSVGGGLSNGTSTNPAFRILTVDGNYTGSSWEVLDFSHYYLDLQSVNNGGTVTWKHEYTAKDMYKMPSLFPQDWSNLVYRMRNNDTLFQQYFTFYLKSAPHTPCTGSCKTNMLCDLKQAGSRDNSLCNDI